MVDSQSTVGHQFDDVVIEEVVESVTVEESEPPVVEEPTEVAEGSMSQQDLSIHAGEM